MKKFVEKMKRFWSLDAKTSGGFTLVELIVVIAILAILAGIAVPAYSGYVEKANKTADQKMVSDVADALVLHYYDNGDTTASGYVVLSQTGATADEYGTAAMEAVFGENWADTAKLTYDGWSDDGLLQLAISQGASAATVPNSSFLTGNTVEGLLSEVTDLTGAALDFLTLRIDNPSLLYDGMMGMFSPTGNATEFNALCAEYGIATKEENGSFVFDYDKNDAEESKEFQTKLSNFVVLAAAKDLTGYKTALEQNPDNPAYTSSQASELVLRYSGYTAAINSGYSTAEAKEAYDNMSQALQTATTINDITAAMDAFDNNVAVQTVINNYSNDINNTGAASNDGIAFLNIMQAVNSVGDTVSDKDMANENLYKSNTVVNAFNTYVSATSAVAGLDAATLDILKNQVTNGSVVVILGSSANGCSVGATPAEALLQ